MTTTQKLNFTSAEWSALTPAEQAAVRRHNDAVHAERRQRINDIARAKARRRDRRTNVPHRGRIAR